jgi:sugar transferase (PEP-CTERM system associated)
MISFFGYYVSKVYLLLGVWEAVVFFASLHLGAYLRFDVFSSVSSGSDNGMITGTAVIFTLVMSASTISLRLYQRGVQEQAAGFVVRLALSFLLGTVIMTLLFYAFPAIFVGRGVLGLSLVIAFLGILVSREIFIRFAAVDSRKRRVLVLGCGYNANRIEELLRENPNQGFWVVGYIPLGDDTRLVEDVKCIKKEGSLLDLAIERDVDEIVVAVDDRRRRLPVNEILDCKMSAFQVIDLITFFEKESAAIKIDLLHPSWIFFSTRFCMSAMGLHGKRIFDLLMCIALLILFAPIMTLVAVASLIESKGNDPILYRQLRVGQNGKLFHLYKFRSMRVDAEADGVARWATKDDARVTRLGAFLRKTRLDELPQIFNVINGHMSLVGPRPERPEFVEQLARKIPFYIERHRVKPGMTGWAQMFYSYGASEEDAKRKLEYDLYYVKHAGVFLDLIILLQTVEIMLLGKGAR